VAEVIMGIAYAQFKLSRGLLNSDMCASGEKDRNFQISKARGVALSHLVCSIEVRISPTL
jgi:hypothetical protein